MAPRRDADTETKGLVRPRLASNPSGAPFRTPRFRSGSQRATERGILRRNGPTARLSAGWENGVGNDDDQDLICHHPPREFAEPARRWHESGEVSHDQKYCENRPRGTPDHRRFYGRGMTFMQATSPSWWRLRPLGRHQTSTTAAVRRLDRARGGVRYAARCGRPAFCGVGRASVGSISPE